MRMEQALKLTIGSRVLAGNSTMHLISYPEPNMWNGKAIARVTVADELLRTRIYTHEEIEPHIDRVMVRQ